MLGISGGEWREEGGKGEKRGIRPQRDTDMRKKKRRREREREKDKGNEIVGYSGKCLFN